MRLGPGSREVEADGLMEDEKPRGFFAGLVVPGTAPRRTLWGPWVFCAGMVDVETGLEACSSLAWTRTLRGPSVDFPAVLTMGTTGLGRLPIVAD